MDEYDYGEQAEGYEIAIDDLEERIAQLEAALRDAKGMAEFYAEGKNYNVVHANSCGGCIAEVTEGGVKARGFLEKHRAMLEGPRHVDNTDGGE